MPRAGAFVMPGLPKLPKDAVPPLPRTPKLPPGPPRPPLPRRFAVTPRGPRFLRGGTVLYGPGVAPPGFVTATTSGDEWILYWAFAKVFHDPVDPRQPPFWGSRVGLWGYQMPVGGGRHKAGGSVPDFWAQGATDMIIIRMQNEYHHVYADPAKKASDALQKAQTMQRWPVVDIYAQDVIEDPSGQAAIVAVKRALGLVENQSPITGATARRTRAGKGVPG